MHWLNGFRSGAFRFALLLAIAFAVSAVLLLVVVERSVSHYATEATDGSLKSEAVILQGEDREGGPNTLLKTISLHRRAGGQDAFLYRLTDKTGHMLVNDLGDSVVGVGWGEASVREGGGGSGGKHEVFKSLGVPTADGGVLIVATDTYDIQKLRRKLDRFAILAGITITLVALVGGYVTGGLFMRRLDKVNDAIARVRAGNVAERLPMIGISPEFNLLSTNLNAMLDQIAALLSGLQQVTTDIAHDLRTPLTRLRQHLEATRESGSVQRYEAGIDSALVQTDEILAIFRALLRIGTLEGGEGAQYFTTVDLSEIVERAAAAHQPVAEDEGKILSFAIEPALSVHGDGELIAQMVVNLIDNAIRHTPRGSRITCELERVDGSIVATITDDGPGIPAKEHTNVLTRFYRLDRSRNLPGAGLGMSMVAAIAALHRIQLQLVDNCPGLRIRLIFPKTAALST
ncbi:HAMP domain-containing sensor histidine kinase [Telmatospirillum sp.]|uniref:HAMP domain-containing sensor histidine kinase n=1 Tax=Telmatospirillum sp. TaxID=2079197 RepID=UPI0028454C4C|nr:HAMP domain-containing sensor histidine kinase [Telmatospirillum sp.]MDR3437257.1 HAMP domain-containing sensor histidine kinase [Telmatospirillum sp.]